MNLRTLLSPVSLLGLCGLSVLPAVAEIPPRLQTPLEEIVVVANKVPRSIHRIAANVSVLEKQEIEDTLSTSMRDLFQYAPGIDTESAGTRFGEESFNIRGIGGNRVALLIDGVPLADQFDVGRFSNATRDFINTGLVQRAEVLHGPASTLYGSDAIGGVVAMYTPDPDDVLRGQRHGGNALTTYRDGDSSHHLQATLASELGKTAGALSFIGGAAIREGHEFESGSVADRVDTKDYSRRSLLLKLVADDYAGHSWRLGYIHQASDAQSDLRSMLGSGRFRSTTKLLGDDEATLDLLTLEYDLNALTPWFDSSLLRSYHLRSDVEQNTIDERGRARSPVSIDRAFAFQQDTTGVELNLQKQINGDRLVHQIGAGLEFQISDVQEQRDATQTSLPSGQTTNAVLGEVFPVRDFPNSETTKSGAYLEYTVGDQNWSLIAALRADRFKLGVRPDDIYLEDNADVDVVSLDEFDVSPKLGLIYHLNDRADVYLQYAHGFRAPPFEDANIGLDIPLFNIRAIPNPDLKSESSNGVDVGFRWIGEKSRFHLGYFRTRYDDFIETKVRLGLDPASGRILFQSQNLTNAKISGVEAGWEFQLPANFSVNGALFVANGTDLQNQRPLDSVGPDQLVVGAAWRSAEGRRTIRVNGTLSGKAQVSDPSPSFFRPDNYALVDLYYSEQLSRSWTLRAALQNLTNETYWHWSSVRGLESNDPILATLARPGRQASMSVNFVW